MKKLFCLTAMLLSLSASAFSQNTLTVEDFTLPQTGGTMSVQITLDEAGVYSAYQFDIVTPNGIVYPVDQDGDVDCTLGSSYDSSHSETVHWNPETGLLGVGVISMKSALFKATTLALDIPLAATTAAVGTQLELTVKDIIIIKQSGEKVALNDVHFTITIGEADDRVRLDENSTVMPEAAEGVDVKVIRTIKANQWSTLCLPFDMTAEQVTAAFGEDVQLAYFTGYDVEKNGNDVLGITINFEDYDWSEGFYANYPYLIKTSKDITEFSLTTDITPDIVQETFSTGMGSKKKTGKFIGTYQAMTVVPAKSLFLSNNSFWYSAGLTKMKAFRAYFTLSDVLTDAEEAGARIVISIDETPTGINFVKSGEEKSNVYFDLMGCRTEKPRKGIYIVNGKKIVIK